MSAVQWHHDPESCAESCNLSDIVHAANTMGNMTGYGKIDHHLALEHFSTVADRLGLAPENLEEMARQTDARVKKLMASWA